MTDLFLPPPANSLSYAFGNSDFVGQSICVILFLFSILTWVVMLEKIFSLRRSEQGNDRFLRLFREKRNPLALTNNFSIPPCPAATLYFTALEKIEAFHLREGNIRRALNDAELGIVRSSLDQTIEEQIMILEKRMMFLATAVSASPFLGLFGTVWGITLAFTNLAIKGKADIQTLAPGVSGALLTTVIALIVAIPSLVGYNIITAKLKKMTVLLDNFAEEFHSRLKIEQMDSFTSVAPDGTGQ